MFKKVLSIFVTCISLINLSTTNSLAVENTIEIRGNISPNEYKTIKNKNELNQELKENIIKTINATKKGNKVDEETIHNILREEMPEIYGLLLMDYYFAFNIDSKGKYTDVKLLSMLSPKTLSKLYKVEEEDAFNDILNSMTTINSFSARYGDSKDEVEVLESIIEYMKEHDFKYKFSSESLYENNSIYSLIKEKESMCLGIAQMVYNILNTTNLKHRIALIQNNKTGVYHIYNEVFVDGKWVEFDVSYILDNNKSVDYIINNKINIGRFKVLHSYPIKKGEVVDNRYIITN